MFINKREKKITIKIIIKTKTKANVVTTIIITFIN